MLKIFRLSKAYNLTLPWSRLWWFYWVEALLQLLVLTHLKWLAAMTRIGVSQPWSRSASPPMRLSMRPSMTHSARLSMNNSARLSMMSEVSMKPARRFQDRNANRFPDRWQHLCQSNLVKKFQRHAACHCLIMRANFGQIIFVVFFISLHFIISWFIKNCRPTDQIQPSSYNLLFVDKKIE